MAIQLDTDAGPSRPSAVFKSVATLQAHTRSVTALRFTPDGQTFVSAGADGYVHFWDGNTGSHRRAMRCHRTGINDISVSPDGLYLATASDDNTSLVWPMDALSASAARPSASADGTPAAPASTLSALNPTPLRTLKGHTAPVLAIAFSPRSTMLVTGSFDESATVWDVRRGVALRTMPAHAEAIWSVGWDPEGALVLTGGADGLIRLWDVNSGQCLKTIDNESNSPVSSASFTPSSFFILSATLSSTVRVFSLHTGKVLKTLRAAEYVSERFPCPTVVFSGHDLPHGLTNGHAKPSAPNADSDAMDVDGAATPSSDVAALATIRAAWVATGSENGKVVVWDLQDRRVLAVLEGHSAPVVAIAVSPDGRTIVSGSIEPDRSIRLWRAV